MKTSILYLFTRTPMHVGAGSSVGAIDMPIQRERHTQIPIIPGSSLKGVLRDLWDPKDEQQKAEQVELFGPESGAAEHFAGNLLVGEARVVCFPVRSAAGSFAWITSPLALARYARDVGKTAPKIEAPDDDDGECCLAGSKVAIKDSVVLEEYAFKVKGKSDPAVGLLRDALPNDELWNSLAGRLVVVSDGIFSHFCATACEVQQRIRIDDTTNTVAQGGLFNQENVPSETLFYAVMGERKDNGLSRLGDKLHGKTEDGKRKFETALIQIGGDETIGLGFCTVRLAEVK